MNRQEASDAALAPLVAGLRAKIEIRRKANSRPWVKVLVDANDLELLIDAVDPRTRP